MHIQMNHAPLNDESCTANLYFHTIHVGLTSTIRGEVSVEVSCACGFRGEVSVGRLMDVSYRAGRKHLLSLQKSIVLILQFLVLGHTNEFCCETGYVFYTVHICTTRKWKFEISELVWQSAARGH